jgi:hypothetical protein
MSFDSSIPFIAGASTSLLRQSLKAKSEFIQAQRCAFPTIYGCFVLGCQCFVARIYCDGQYFYWAFKVGLWKQARELGIISEPKSTAPFILPAGKVTQGDIPLWLMQTPLRSRLSQLPHWRHIKDERKELLI